MNNIILKKKIHEMGFLKYELKETTIKYNDYLNIFNNFFKEELKYISEKKNNTFSVLEENNIIENISENSSKNEESIDNNIDEENKLLKSIYKKVSIVCHPDKNNNIKKNKFEKINKYYKTKNLIRLIMIAKKFNIKIPEITDLDLELIDKNINDTKIEINELRTSAQWIWCTSDENNKIKIKERLYEIWNIDKNFNTK